MILDANQLPLSHLFKGDLCIVGAGAAGLALAMQFLDSKIRVILLEAGGLKPNSASQSLYDGEVAGLPMPPLQFSRSRYFGGSTNCWGGYCSPMDTDDFAAAALMERNDVWPFGADEVAPFLARAHALLCAPDATYDQVFWAQEFAKRGLKFIEFEKDLLNVIKQATRPARFGRLYLDSLRKAENITVVLNANVTRLVGSERADCVSRAEVATLAQNRLFTEAKVFALCAGGIENARILLASGDDNPQGLGNRSGFVGSFFMDHPRFRTGRFRLRDQASHRLIYDGALSQWRQRTSTGPRVAVDISLTKTRRTELKIRPARHYFVAEYPFSETEAYAYVKTVKSVLNRARLYGADRRQLTTALREPLRGLFAGAPFAILTILDVLTDFPWRPRTFNLETVLDPTPIASSRVTLDASRRDRLDCPTVCVDWRLSPNDWNTLEASSNLVLGELGRSGIAKFIGQQPDVQQVWAAGPQSSWHHLGTTRMSGEADKGVVDANGKVHEIENLYISGGSVFPAAGTASPTLMIVTLALRLASHLKTLARLN